MTAPEMNATGGKIRIAGRGAALAVSACFGLAGCLSFSPQTDPASPAAARVDALVAANRGYPDWEDFPSGPRPVPAPAEIVHEVAQLNITGDAMSREVAAIDWTLSDPEAWAASVRSRLDAAFAAPPPPDVAARIEAMAEALRQRAEPPPQLTRPAPRR